jgi:hypothetical protein
MPQPGPADPTARLRRSMGLRSRSRSRTLVRALSVAGLLTVALAACTGDEAPPPEESPVTSPPPVTSADSYVFTDAAGIEARLTLDVGDAATLRVLNDTGEILPKLGVYVLDARDGSHVDWTVVGAGPVPRGRSEWQVTRPAVPEAKHVGLVVMLFGGEDYGAFVPPQPGGAS